jgi:hypothetical protein
MHVGDDRDFHSEFEEVQPVILDCDILEYEGVPRHLWTTKCVTLYNNNGIIVAEEICQRIRFNIVIRIVGPLGETHFAF